MKQKNILYPGSKINLILDVKGKRTDGFHELEMIMLRLSLTDRLEIEPAADSNEVILSINPPVLTSGEGNLVMRAARLLQKEAGGTLPGVKITLYKNVPIAAGLGGGSADCAAALNGLNSFWQLGLKNKKLLELAADLGSDVPFFLESSIALAQGRGEKLSAAPPMPSSLILLANPGIQIYTPDVYAYWQGERVNNAAKLLDRLQHGDLEGVINNTGNALEPAAERLCPGLSDFREILCSLGLGKPILSGSGSTYFIILSEQAKRYIDRSVKKLHAQGYWAEVVSPCTPSCL